MTRPPTRQRHTWPRCVVIPGRASTRIPPARKARTIFYTIVTLVTIAVNGAGAAAAFASARFITDTFADIKVPPGWLPVLASLQAAGALGLLLGLLGVPAIGLAAAAGLALYFLGAMIAHLRAGAYRSLASPLLFLALAVTTLVLTIAR